VQVDVFGQLHQDDRETYHCKAPNVLNDIEDAAGCGTCYENIGGKGEDL
jgi:hypothetical protein